MRFELTTPTLARLCSTPELRPHPEMGMPTMSGRERHKAHLEPECKPKWRGPTHSLASGTDLCLPGARQRR